MRYVGYGTVNKWSTGSAPGLSQCPDDGLIEEGTPSGRHDPRGTYAECIRSCQRRHRPVSGGGGPRSSILLGTVGYPLPEFHMLADADAADDADDEMTEAYVPPEGVHPAQPPPPPASNWEAITRSEFPEATG